jgi:hypothetical protein
LTKEVVNGVLYPYTSDKNNAQKFMFIATGEPIDVLLVVLANL